MTGYPYSSSLGLNRKRQAVLPDEVNLFCTSRGHPFLLTLSLTYLNFGQISGTMLVTECGTAFSDLRGVQTNSNVC
jgi:hypothetical protein